ncbi:class A beta-lactamase [Parasphingorhabdus cellanae]|uniref:beta-lactamase n=1 Tax=Parasphingorhabdus cellanae TaxID=2806553 RepID=A0ABX7T8Z4_9SPHN|nr:class A beta-lactamase [Parasphingorhabdus cellanae]QTD57017.1 class A beta-lactamase [Parasphingorhabdus cellanae]
MAYVRFVIIVFCVSVLTACVAPSQGRSVVSNEQRETPRPRYENPPPQKTDTRSQNRPDPALEREVADLWRSFPGKTGIAIKSIDSGWSIGHRADQDFPQQSVSKLWVAMALLDKVDQGRVSLSDAIQIGPDDLTLFYQPLAAEVKREGAVVKSVYTLLERALAYSDNTANDVLLRHAGGPDAVNDFIRRKGLGKIKFGPGERLMQSQIAGLKWSQNLSVGRKFYTARANLPIETRRKALAAYLADPIDGASPGAIVGALDQLARGELLSENSTQLLQSILKRTRSGPNRLKAGVPAGWDFLHKTGTGQILGAVSTGYNDVGIMTAPDGSRYAVAVMLGDTTASIPERMRLMQSVTRAVGRYHRR